MYVQNALKMHNAYSSPQLVKNHIVQGLVFGPDLEDDLVGTTIGDTKLRSNIYYSENEHWKEVVVSGGASSDVSLLSLRADVCSGCSTI